MHDRSKWGHTKKKATEIYATTYNQSPEAVAFYECTRTMRFYPTIIAENTTPVLSTDSDLFKFLKGMSPDGVRLPGQRTKYDSSVANNTVRSTRVGTKDGIHPRLRLRRSVNLIVRSGWARANVVVLNPP